MFFGSELKESRCWKCEARSSLTFRWHLGGKDDTGIDVIVSNEKMHRTIYF